MKTLLFIGVLVAVISWSSALECWGPCQILGEKLDTNKCNKGACPTENSPNDLCATITMYEKDGKKSTVLSCGRGKPGTCAEKEADDHYDGKKTKTCVCDKDLCNNMEEPKKNGAQAGTSYSHFIIAFIVGAIFFH